MRAPELLPLALVVALLLLLPLRRAGMHLSIDFGEGWNAYVAQAVLQGEPIYPPPGSLTPVNYPPLWFYLLAGLHRWTGVALLPLGRLVALAALGVVTLEVVLIARACGANGVSASAGALMFLGLVAAAAPRYVGQNDPQWVAHAVMESSLLVYLGRPPLPAELRRLVTAALIVLALSVKHNLLAWPVALALAVTLAEPQRLPHWGLALGGLGVAAVLTMDRMAGGWLLPNLLLRRRYRLDWLVRTSAIAWTAMLVPLVIVWAARSRKRPDPPGRLVRLYLGCALVVGTLLAGGSGTDVNMFFSAFVASAVGFALALTAFEAPAVRLATLAVAAWLACALPFRTLTPARSRQLRAREAETAADVRFLRGRPGPAYCEQMLLCYWAGKPLVLQPYFVPEQIATGELDWRAVARLFERRTFGALQLDRPINGPAPADGASRLPPRVLDAIRQHYRLARTSLNGAFYVPAERPPAGTRRDRPERPPC